MDLSVFKKSKDQQFAKISASLEQLQNPNSNKTDDRYWKVVPDKVGNGTATIRFLPDPNPENSPFVRLFTHGFKGPTGKWYIENSLSTLSEDDPVSEFNSRLWNSGIESDKDIVRTQTKRRTTFISNILVISDPTNPENNGKVFLFKYGKKIFAKIMDKMKPTFQDELPVNIFDLWEGADFKLKMCRVEGYANFDKSEFSLKENDDFQKVGTSLFKGDENKISDVMDLCYNLSELLDRKHFKTYDELLKKFNSVWFPNGGVGYIEKKVSTQVNIEPSNLSDDDDTMEYFAKLAADD